MHCALGILLSVTLVASYDFGKKQGVQFSLQDTAKKNPMWYEEGGDEQSQENRIPRCRAKRKDNEPMYPVEWAGTKTRKESLGGDLFVWRRDSDWSLKTNLIPEVAEEEANPMEWEDAASTVPKGEVMVWTLVGGKAYQASMLTFKGMMDELNIKHAAFVCLDETCLRTAAALKMMALTYEFKGNMKKRVGGIKFGATAEFARLGVPALFMELDVFFRKSPLPYFAHRQDSNIIVSAHGDSSRNPNIGVYFVRPGECTANFFQNLTNYMKDDTLPPHNCGLPFDQALFTCCLLPDKDTRPNCPELARSESCISFHMVDSSVICSSDPPEGLGESTAGIHVLSAKPFLPVSHKGIVAKHLGFWPNENGYYDSSSAKYLVMTRPISVNSRHAIGLFKTVFIRTFAVLLALAQATNRILILPRMVAKMGIWAWPYSALNLETLDGLVEWREQDFLDDPKTKIRGTVAKITTWADCELEICVDSAYDRSFPELCDVSSQHAQFEDFDDSIELALEAATKTKDVRDAQLLQFEPSLGRLINMSPLAGKLAKEAELLLGLCMDIEYMGKLHPDCAALMLRGSAQQSCTAEKGKTDAPNGALIGCQARWELAGGGKHSPAVNVYKKWT